MTENKKPRQTLSARISGLLNKNSFLKLLSVLLAVITWIYILYVINPVNDKEFNKISVDLAYEGSIPERNGYMYLLTDTNLTVSVNVTGSRSELLNLTAEDIKATLNLDPITTAGTHSVAVSVSTGNKNLTVSDYNPKSFTIEFATVATRTMPVELQASGALPDGYVIETSEISPKEVTITGPSTTVESIDKVYLSVPLTNVKESINGTYDLSIVNKNGENVDRRFLTVSDTDAEASLSVLYRKEMNTTVDVINSSGGNESSYISVTLDTATLQATGDESVLSGIKDFSVGTIDTSTITASGTYEIALPAMEGATFNKTSVNARVEIAKDTGIKEITFAPADIKPTNMPAGTAARPLVSLTVRIRARSADLDLLTAENLKCQVDYTDKNDDGSFPVIVYPVTSNGTPFGVVGSYVLTSDQVEIYESRIS